jgi:hypothetical protein
MIVGDAVHIGAIGQAITHLPPIGPVVEVYSPQAEDYIRRTWWYKHPRFIRRYAGEPALLGAHYGSKNVPLQVPGYVAGEYAFIQKKIGPYRRTMQSLLNVNGRHIDRIDVVDGKGVKHAFFFDVSGPMDEGTRKLKAVWEEMKREDPTLGACCEPCAEGRPCASLAR